MTALPCSMLSLVLRRTTTTHFSICISHDKILDNVESLIYYKLTHRLCGGLWLHGLISLALYCFFLVVSIKIMYRSSICLSQSVFVYLLVLVVVGVIVETIHQVSFYLLAFGPFPVTVLLILSIHLLLWLFFLQRFEAVVVFFPVLSLISILITLFSLSVFSASSICSVSWNSSIVFNSASVHVFQILVCFHCLYLLLANYTGYTRINPGSCDLF